MSKQSEERNEKVRAVLLAAHEDLGPTEIAERVNESWCCKPGTHRGVWGSSAVITPICRRIGAIGLKGKWALVKP